MKSAGKLSRILSFCCAVASAQACIAQHSFDVVSIRPIQHEDAGFQMSIMNPSKQGTFRASGITVRTLLGISFGLPQDRIVGGPSWIDENLYRIDAQLDPEQIDKLKALSEDEARALRRKMLQSMLLERFRLHFHGSSQLAAVYEIVSTPGVTAKLTQEAENLQSTHTFAVNIDGDYTSFQHASLGSLAEIFGQALDLPVLDKTGLTGYYDGKLRWTPGLREREPNSVSSLLSYALLHDCGLKLVRTKSEVETISIDQISLPTEN